MKLPVVTPIENPTAQPLWGESLRTNLSLRDKGNDAKKGERLCRTELTEFQREAHGLKHSLLQRQIRQINIICGDARDITVVKADVNQTHTYKKKFPLEIDDDHRFQHHKGPQWTSYRDMAGVSVHITHASEFTAPPSPAQPHKPINRFQTTAAVYKLCQEMERADFTGKSDDIIDLCAAFDAMKI